MGTRSMERQGGSPAMRRIGLVFLLTYVALVGLLVAGDAFASPSVWQGLGANALWLVPMVGAALLAWHRPDAALGPLTAATVAVALLNVWYAFDGPAWRSFEAAHGPIRGVAALALCGALGAYGYRRPLTGGVLLLFVAVVPLALAAVAVPGFGLASLVVLPAPGAVAGLLYVGSVAVGGGGSSPPTGRRAAERSEPRELARASSPRRAEPQPTTPPSRMASSLRRR